MATSVLMYQSESGKIFNTLYDAEREDWVEAIMVAHKKFCTDNNKGMHAQLAEWAARDLLEWVYDNRIKEM